MRKIVASIVGMSLLGALALDLPASAANKSTQVNSASTDSINTDRLAAKKVKAKSPISKGKKK